MIKKIIITVTIIASIFIIILLLKNNNNLDNIYKYPVSKNNYYDDYVYDVYSDHINIIAYNGSDKNIIIPALIDDLPVLSIEDSAFYGNSDIETVVIPYTVIKIGNQSFIGCLNLKSLDIPKSIIFVGDNALDNCPNLESIYINKNTKQKNIFKNYKKYIKYK